MQYLKQLAELAAQKPFFPALIDREGTRATTRGDLAALSDRIAARLLQMGLKKGGAVMILLPRCAEFIAAEIGILKAGGAAVPLSDQYPEDRVSYIANDTGAEITVDADFMDTLPEDADFTPVPIEQDDPVLLSYTSGSTGKPKGVVYTAAAYDDGVIRMSALCSDLPDIRFGAAAPLSFIVRLLEYAANLYAGGTVYMLSEETRQDIRLLEIYYEKHSLTCGFFPPRMLNMYRNRDASLKRVITGSERVSNVYSEEYESVCVYGQTEGVLMTGFVIDKPYENTPIGVPGPGVEIRLLDEEGNDAPNGEAGEICAIGVFPREYLHLPEESEKHFVPLSDGRVMVRTGDLGKRLDSGAIQFLNRMDWMVKINGQRVEPGEIEAAMRAIPRVQNAAVRDFTWPHDRVFLCGYYVADKKMSAHEVRFYLQRALPDYMIPEKLVQLDTLPLNKNGKLDRSALPEPQVTRDAEPMEPPVTETEKLVCRKVSEILQCGPVGLTDDFLALGGDSVNAAKLALELEESGIGAVSASDVYRYPKLRDLAAFLGHGQIGSEDVFCYSQGRPGVTPVFFVHTANTGAESYRAIAQALGTEVPFYCIENHNINYPDIQVRTIEKIGKLYLTFMKDICPHGPYRLGGWSFGGSVAFEMALQLEAAGEQVEDLILLDPMLLPEESRAQALKTAWDPNLKKYFNEEPVFQEARSAFGADYLFENNRKTAQDIVNYEPARHYRGRVLFFNATVIRGSDQVKNLARRRYANGFGAYCDDIEVIDVNANHDELALNGRVIRAVCSRCGAS